jgi:ferric-dicitrate binding protein FerR (iron transport regulator)
LEKVKTKLKLLLTQTNWNPEDRKWLLEFLDSGDTNLLQELLREDFFSEINASIDQHDEAAKEILDKIHQKISAAKRKSSKTPVVSLKWISVAASFFLLAFSAYFFLYNKQSNPITVVEKPSKQDLINDFVPGEDKAVLTLADGSVVILDDASNGNIALQGAVQIQKVNDGKLQYQAGGEELETVFNSVSTPKGGKFQLTLSDGTKVWLNSSSSLKFPVVFNGNERKVELHGEGYFEVAENKQKPFRVDVSGKGEVEVLGTHFNVNAYADEVSLNTTLLEGSVKVRVGASSKPSMLIPGQQARIFPNGEVRTTSNINIEEVVAWKNGKFHFGESTDMETVMRQIGRWYDVEVEYSGNFSGKHLGGTISRDVNASKVFEMLEMTGIAKFRIVGKKVLVVAQNN